MQHALVGFECTSDSVISGEFVPFEHGLTVLYGLNGAGKTRLLDGMRNALTGVRSDIGVDLVVRVQRPDANDRELDNRLLYQGSRAPGVDLLVRLAMTLTGPKDRDTEVTEADRYVQTVSLSQADAVVDELIRQHAIGTSGSAPGFEDEVLRDRLFLLRGMGTPEAPSWDVWPVANVAGPATRSALEQQRREWTEAESDSQKDFPLTDVLARWDIFLPEEHSFQDRDGRGLHLTHFAGYNSAWSLAELVEPIRLHGAIDLGIDVLEVPIDPDIATHEYVAEISLLAARDSLRPDDNSASDDYAAPSTDLNERGWQLGRGDGIHEYVRRELRQSDRRRAREEVDVVVAAVAGDLESRVGRALEAFLPDAPRPRLSVPDPALRLVEPMLRWSFGWDDSVRYQSLSNAERRLTALAVAQALYWHKRDLARPLDPLRPVITLVDEPENGLHRAAEARVAHALEQQAQDPRVVTVAATHSPELLDVPSATLIEVQRGRGRSSVQRLDLGARESLERLGLTPSDLLRWPRVFLLVEGTHDVEVLNAYIGDRLRAARVELIPLRGATKLPNTVDSRVLFKFSRAQLVALLDNQPAEHLQETWQRSRQVALESGVQAATQILVDGLDDSEEARFFKNWLALALERGEDARIHPYGLAARDVIEYLDVTRLVPGAQSWDELRLEHDEAKAQGKGAARDFKKWLSIARDADIRSWEGRLHEAVLPDAPLEVKRLATFLEAMSGERLD